MVIRWRLVRSSQCLTPACTSFGNSAGAPLAGFVTAHSRHSSEAFDQVRAKRQLEAGFYHQCVEGDQQGAALGRGKHHGVSADVAERTGAVVNTVTGRPKRAHGHGLSVDGVGERAMPMPGVKGTIKAVGWRQGDCGRKLRGRGTCQHRNVSDHCAPHTSSWETTAASHLLDFYTPTGLARCTENTIHTFSDLHHCLLL